MSTGRHAVKCTIHTTVGQRRRERSRARAQQRRERLREVQLSQRRAGRVDGPRGRITGPGTYDLGGGVTITFGEGTLVKEDESAADAVVFAGASPKT